MNATDSRVLMHSAPPIAVPTASIDKGLESKDNHRAKMLFAITSRKGTMRNART